MRVRLLVAALIGALAFAGVASAAPMFKGAAPEASVFPNITSVNLMTLLGASSGGSRPLSCPQGNADPNDGCAAAPAPLTAMFRQANAFQPGGWLNTEAGTSVNYMASNCGDSGTAACRPPGNAAGADYAIGPYMTLTDPQLHVPVGCSLSASGTQGSTVNLITCGNNSGIGSTFLGNLQAYEFGAINGHGCTGLRVRFPQSGVTTLIEDNIHFFNDSGLCIGQFGSPYWQVIDSSTYPGGIFITSSLFDGNGIVFDDIWGPVSLPNCTGEAGAGTKCNPSNSINFGINDTSVKYSVFKNWAAQTLGPVAGVSFTFQYNVMDTWCTRIPSCHTEWYNGQAGATKPLVLIDHNIIVNAGNVNSGSMQFGPSGVQISAGWPLPVTDWEFTNNVQVDPFIGGYTAINGTISGCVGDMPTGGTDASPVCPATNSNILYVTKQTAKIGHGMVIGSPCVGVAGIYQEVPNTYPIHNPSGGADIIDEWTLDQPSSSISPASYSPNFLTNFTVTSCAMSSQMANVAVMSGHGATPFTTSNNSHNYIDATSQGGGTTPQLWTIGNVSAEPSVTLTGATIITTGGVSTLTVTGGTPVPLLSISGVGVATAAGTCAASIGNCPRIAAGSTGPNWVLDTPVTTDITTPETMTGLRTSWCVTKTGFVGNINMNAAVAVTEAWMDHWSTVNTQTFGCN